MNNKTIIELKDVTKIYRRGREEIHALDKINLNIIGCIDRPTSGMVIIDGEDVTKEKEDWFCISAVLFDPNLDCTRECRNSRVIF